MTYFIVEYVSNALISDDDTSSGVAEYAVALDLREAAATYQYPTSLVLIDVILSHMWTAVKHNNSIIVVIDLVVLYPAEATLNNEYAFTPGWIYFIVCYYSFWRAISSQGYVCLEIGIDLIKFYVGICTLH